MNLGSLLNAGVDSVIDSVSNLIDVTFTSDEERLKAKEQLLKIQTEERNKANVLANEFEKEITERWKSDNENLITRLVRPAITVFIYVLFGAVILTDGNIGDFHKYLSKKNTEIRTVFA